jgi:hypothetical protein
MTYHLRKIRIYILISLIISNLASGNILAPLDYFHNNSDYQNQGISLKIEFELFDWEKIEGGKKFIAQTKGSKNFVKPKLCLVQYKNYENSNFTGEYYKIKDSSGHEICSPLASQEISTYYSTNCLNIFYESSHFWINAPGTVEEIAISLGLLFTLPEWAGWALLASIIGIETFDYFASEQVKTNYVYETAAYENFNKFQDFISKKVTDFNINTLTKKGALVHAILFDKKVITVKQFLPISNFKDDLFSFNRVVELYQTRIDYIHNSTTDLFMDYLESQNIHPGHKLLICDPDLINKIEIHSLSKNLE